MRMQPAPLTGTKQPVHRFAAYRLLLFSPLSLHWARPCRCSLRSFRQVGQRRGSSMPRCSK